MDCIDDRLQQVQARLAAVAVELAAPAIADELASPRLVDAWADAIVAAWLAAEAAGGIDLTLPLQLVDLAPGRGRLAAQLLPRLNDKLAAIGRGHWQWRYLACAGQLDEVDIHPGNPLTVLALGAFGCHAPMVYGIHYGKLLDCQIRNMPTEEAGVYELAFDWLPAELTTAPSAALLDDYRIQLNSAAVSIPEQALTQLDVLAERSGGRYLLLAADYGVTELRDIRLGALSLPASWTVGQDGLPVNFHALTRWQQQQGALVINRQDECGGLTLHVAWRDDLHPAAIAVDALADRLATAHPADHAAMLEAAQNMPPSLALLRASQHDPYVFSRMLPALLEQLPDADRAAWWAALDTVWRHAVALPVDTNFAIELAWLAGALDHYALARAVLTAMLEVEPGHGDAVYWLAEIEARTGRADVALGVLGRMLGSELDQQGRTPIPPFPEGGPGGISAPSQLAMTSKSPSVPLREGGGGASQLDTSSAHPSAQNLLETLQSRMADAPTPPLRRGPLTLDPLHPDHAPALFHQYRDPQISVMVRLDGFESLADAQAWIADLAATPERQHLAVMHADFGLVGVLCLTRIDNAAYFHFWIGADFQGRGFGEQAARLLLDSPAVQTLDALFTSAFADNYRSQKTLARLGWLPLPIKALPPDDDMLFFHYPLQGAPLPGADEQAMLIAQLIAFCSQSDSAFRFAADLNKAHADE
ncbi:GNAT family N-acetyltransferase [Andreprevotia chitinilytica]|uniref:GNAT family N-acetyltransferase n=1 Tax=Andreprevotia chitinilytica TaxID=396808 RepID=UPI00055868AC|nr:GNAT family N-acetyltransferase [Andreprevotia chitinilytica]